MVFLTATKAVQTPGWLINSVIKLAMSFPVGLMLVTADKVMSPCALFGRMFSLPFNVYFMCSFYLAVCKHSSSV